MKVRTREHSPKKTEKYHEKGFQFPKERTFFWVMWFFLLCISAFGFKTDSLSSIVFLFCAIIIFIIQLKNPLIIQYQALQNSDVSSNIKHHQLYYPDGWSEKKLFQQSLFQKKYRQALIYSILKISFFTLLSILAIILFFTLLMWDPVKNSGIISGFHLSIALGCVFSILSVWVFFIHKKYTLIKKEVYYENNKYYFLVFKRRKYYYEVWENENGGNDYIIY